MHCVPSRFAMVLQISVDEWYEFLGSLLVLNVLRPKLLNKHFLLNAYSVNEKRKYCQHHKKTVYA